MKNVEDIYALSPMQQGLLFHTLADSASGAYIERVSWSLNGQLNVAAFRAAWEQLIQQHTILRTAFVHEGLDKPLQIVRQRVKLPWAQEDWQSLSPVEQQTRLASVIEGEQRGFKLSEAPLMRLTLIRLAPEVYHFVWSYHHLLLDGWSVSLILKEVLERYGALSQGTPLQIAGTRPFRDYIAWLQQQDIKHAENYWREMLKGFISPTSFGGDGLARNTTARKKHYRDRQSCLSVEATGRLQATARQHQLTLNTLVQGAWGLLLSRYSGEDDVVFGTVVSGRPTELPGSENMVGLFINTLPLRVRVKEGERVREWLKRLQAQQAEMRRYEYSPLLQVQQWSEVNRGQSLFESIVVFENLAGDEGLRRLSTAIEVRNLVHHEMTTGYPLTLAVVPGQELRIQITYDSARFEEAAVERMVWHLEKLLEGMATDTEQFVATLPMLTAAEERALEEWNETARDYPHESAVHELFERQVKRTPGAVALVYEEEQVTYAELNERANRLANYLRSRGVGAEARVGLLVERSVEMVVGLWGIIKAGGAYVPLNGEYPVERLRYMIEDAGVEVVLGHERLLERLGLKSNWQSYQETEDGSEQQSTANAPEQQESRNTTGMKSSAAVVCLEAERELIAAESAENLSAAAGANNLAYVIYTSGSTGQPKGVMVEHRQLINTLCACQEIYQLTPADTVPCLAPFAFDIFLFEVLAPLLAGATCLLLPHRHLLDPQGCADTLSRITFMHAVPALMREVVAAAERHTAEGRKAEAEHNNEAGHNKEAGSYEQVRGLFVGGDAVSPELVRGMQAAFPEARIYIGYGPTEATIMCANVEVRRGERVVQHLLGNAMSNTSLRLYDRQLNLVPVGVTGEIYIGGRSVTRGYLGRGELTREKYVEIEGERFYRSGDLGLRLEDGRLVFMGRADEQVKVRGFRIEVGEVEARLREAEGVCDAFVLARVEEGGETRLVAYLVGEGEERLRTHEVRRQLQEWLPEYMIPAAFVQLEKLPLTLHGKVDKLSLPEPEASGGSERAYAEEPRTPVEEMVAAVWGEVLGRERVGAAENFFELGGHSLMATQVVSRVQQVCGVEVAIGALFEHPTVRGLAAVVEAGWQAAGGVTQPPLSVVSRGETLPLSYAQQRLWFIEQLRPVGGLNNMALALRLVGRLDMSALRATLSEVIRRHEVLRTTFVLEDGEPRQQIADEVSVTVALIDVSGLPEARAETEARRIAVDEAVRGFDLTTGPVVRASLVRRGADEHILLFTLHHIASDGWSMGVLLREVAALYGAYVRGEESTLEELSVQYADFATWQREWLHGEVLEHQVKYWRERLANAPPVLELPIDRARPALQSFRSASVPVEIPARLADALKALSRQEGATLFMTLLAAWQALLSRYSGQTDIVVGVPIANRTRAELEPLIGFFVNTLALRADFSGDPTFAELLRRVREACLGAYQHQDVPFEKLVEELQPERSLSHSPIFQVMVALQNAPMGALELPELILSPVELTENAPVNFELNLMLLEAAGGLKGSVIYHTDLFDATTIERMLEHFLILLEGVVSEPARRLSDVPLLSETEQRGLETEWNDTRRDEYPRGLCLHDLYEAQVAATPEAIALIDADVRLTYAELNHRSNQLARYLKSLGVGPEVCVGLCAERSIELVVAMLAIFKCGGVYVPLDTQHPIERLSFLIEDAGIRVLLTQPHLVDKFAGREAAVVCLDAARETSAGLSVENLEAETRPEHLAYIIYTSGSTGQPKGVMVEHRQLVNTLCATQELHGFQPDDIIPCLAPFSFDISLFELLSPLLVGGRSLLLASRDMLDATLARRVLREVTYLHCVPSLMRQFLSFAKEDGAGEGYRQLRQIFVGGDVVAPDLVQELQQIFPTARIHIGYGPTEATIICAAHTVGRGERVSHQLVGRPLGNVKLQLYDRNRKLVPVGVDGEIYIGGAGITRGYLNREELTRVSFVEIEGERYYRSGDVGWRLDDGTIVFVGRVDEQVKVHGFRIEIGEIEAALSAHEGLAEAAVLARPDQTGERRLTAYVVASNGEPPTAGELRGHLLERLPAFMIPAEFVLLESLPRTPHGKLDKNLLAASVGTRAELGAAYVAPETDVEKLIADVWREVLDAGRVGVNDNFFEVGGTSLLLVKIHHRLRQAVKSDLTIIDLFKYPTVSALAEHVERGQPAEASFGRIYNRVQKQKEIIKRQKQQQLLGGRAIQ